MPASRESLSAQSKRRTNYILLAFGLILLLLFLLAWCSMQTEEKKPTVQESSPDWKIVPIDGNGTDPKSLPNLSNRGDAQLVVTPSSLDAQKVVIGSDTDWPFVLRAENAPVKLESITLAEKQEDGFVLSGACMEKERLARDEECILTVSWSPKTLRSIQNILTILWREDAPSVFKKERKDVILKAQSSDSKDCVICKCDKEEKVPPEVMNSEGGSRPKDPNEEFPGGYKKTEKGYEVPEPDRIPLNLKNELIGSVADNHDVIDFNGKVIGRLSGDDTIIDPEKGMIIGKTIRKTTAMNEHGHVFGNIAVNLGEKTVSVVDAKGKVLGFPRVDGQIVDSQNQQIGFISPWGMVIDSMGNFVGVILPNGMVVNGVQKVASMRPMGFAVGEKGELIGAVVPRGIAVGAAGRSLGQVSLKGEVTDSFGTVVGHVLMDKAIVDADMNEIGSVVRQGVVINESGKPLGFINSEGKALNFKASQIGVVNPDGTVFAGRKFVGTVMPEGHVTQGGCSQVGSVYPNGKVMDITLKEVGFVKPDGKVFDTKNQEIGVVVPWGTAIAEGCKLLGLISLNGDVVSADGVKTGCVNPDRTVQNLQGQKVGEVTPLGLYLNDQNKVIGRVRLDGQIMDNKGAIVGCVYEKQVIFGFNTRGAIVDENGYIIGRSSIGNKAYDELGEWIGEAYFNGWVIGDKGQLVGVVPFSGVVFSDSGKVLGYYDQMTGVLSGDPDSNLGRVLPNLSVINPTGTEIVGKLIPEKTPFVKLDGSFLGSLSSDGTLMGTEEALHSVIHANGSVTDKDGHLIGGRIPMGPVLSGNGKYMGMANNQGEVTDNQGLKIGRVLSNGLAISSKNQLLGQVFPSISVGVSVGGFIGSVEPKMSGTSNNMTYRLQLNDSKGNFAGNVSGTGVILGLDNSATGRLVPIVPFVDTNGKLLGWGNFQGGVNGLDGRPTGTVLPSGIALDNAQNLIGSAVVGGVAVDPFGKYFGMLNTHGEILSSKGERLAVIGASSFLYNPDGIIVGQVLKPGIAVDLNGQWMGWTRFDGQIENGTKVLGTVGLDGHIFDVMGQMIGRYLPLGELAFNDAEKSVGFLSDAGAFMEASGAVVAQMGYEPYVAHNGAIIARQLPEDSFVTSLESGHVLGMVKENGSVLPMASDKKIGSVKMNSLFVNTSNLLEGAMVPAGLAVMPTLGIIGSVDKDGQIYKAGKKTGITTGTGLVYSPDGKLIGGVFTPGVLIDKKGMFAGTTSGTSAVFKDGNQIGNKMAFGSALSTANGWLGNIMPTGGVVTDIGEYYGVISSSGLVTGNKNTFGGRVLPDGSVAGVPERAVFNTMPYAGHTIRQGLPIDITKAGFSVAGKTTVTGDVVDDSAKKLFRIIDNAYVVNKAKQKPPVVGRVQPIISAVNNDGEVMGIPSADGTIVSYEGRVTGRVDNAGLIRLNETQSDLDKYRIQGLLVPEGLVVNNCQIIGQTAYDGRVVNGQGSVVGRIRRDLKAVDANGAEIGHVALNNEFCVKDKQCIGRTLPDSTVVDLNGVEIGCATNSGEVLSPSGEVLCKIEERGIISSKEGEILGWTRACAIWTNGESDQGYVKDGIAYDWNDNPVGISIPPPETIFIDPDKPGWIDTTQGGDDVVKKGGEPVIIVPPKGPVTTPWGDPLPGGPNTIYIPGLGYFSGCDLISYDGQKIASLMADGTLRDENGDLVYTVTPDGQIFAPNGTYVEQIRGLDISSALKQCGISSGAGGKRKIRIGNNLWDVDEHGNVYNDDNEMIGYVNDKGQVVTWDNKPLTGDGSGRTRPDVNPTFKPTKEQIEDFTDKLSKRRQGMKAQFGKGILTISKEMEARAKPKKDKDWSKLGVEKSISTWPVDMTHVILQGKAIPAVLARSIDSRYPTPALAIVETNIYGEEGRNVLIPAGSRLIGTFSGGSDGGQQNGVAKLQISWNRLIRPDGSAFNLAGSQSGDAQGRGGVAAYLDEQLWNKYGTSILSTLATSAVSYMMATNDDITVATNAQTGQQTQYQTMSQKAKAMDDARKNFIDTIGGILDDMIDKAKETPPVVFVPAGTRLTVYPTQDLWLRSVEDDEEEANKEYGEPSTSAGLPNVPSWEEKRKNDRDENSDDSSGPVEVQQETETPLYDGRDRMPDISDRQVQPVVPQEEPLF